MGLVFGTTDPYLGLLAGGVATIAGAGMVRQFGDPRKMMSVHERRDYKRRRPTTYSFAEHNLQIVIGMVAVGAVAAIAGLIGLLLT